MKRKATVIALIGAMILAVGVAAVWFILRPSAGVGKKQISISVTHSDGTEKEIAMNTYKDNLWDMMEEHHLIQGTDGPYGKWITTVDGETADENEKQYWLFTKDGQWVETSCDKTLLADGEHYEFFIQTY